jgi:hypothetical protein
VIGRAMNVGVATCGDFANLVKAAPPTYMSQIYNVCV